MVEQPLQAIDAGDLLVVNQDDQVPILEPRSRGRAPGSTPRTRTPDALLRP